MPDTTSLPLPPGIAGHDGPLALTTSHEYKPCLAWVNLGELHTAFTTSQALQRLRGQDAARVTLTLSPRPAPAIDDPCWLHDLWRSPDQDNALILNWEPQSLHVSPLTVSESEVAAALLIGWVRAGCPGQTHGWAIKLMKISQQRGNYRTLLRGLALPALSELIFSFPESPQSGSLVDSPPKFNRSARQLGFQALRLLLKSRPLNWTDSGMITEYNRLLCEQTVLSLLRHSGAGPITAAWISTVALTVELKDSFPGLKEWVGAARTQPIPVSEELWKHLKHQNSHERWWKVMPSLACGQSVGQADQHYIRSELGQSRDLRNRLLPPHELIPPSSARALSQAIDIAMDADLPRPTQPDDTRARNWRATQHTRLVEAGTQAGLWRSSC